jgi:hypothetical protein
MNINDARGCIVLQNKFESKNTGRFLLWCTVSTLSPKGQRRAVKEKGTENCEPWWGRSKGGEPGEKGWQV